MEALLVLQIIVVTMMVIVILMQHSTSDGFTGSGVSTGGLMTSRGQADALSKITKYLAAIFIINSIVLAVISSNIKREATIIDDIIATEQISSEQDAETGTVDKAEKITAPAEETVPTVPLTE